MSDKSKVYFKVYGTLKKLMKHVEQNRTALPNDFDVLSKTIQLMSIITFSHLLERFCLNSHPGHSILPLMLAK